MKTTNTKTVTLTQKGQKVMFWAQSQNTAKFAEKTSASWAGPDGAEIIHDEEFAKNMLESAKENHDTGLLPIVQYHVLGRLAQYGIRNQYRLDKATNELSQLQEDLHALQNKIAALAA